MYLIWSMGSRARNIWVIATMHSLWWHLYSDVLDTEVWHYSSHKLFIKTDDEMQIKIKMGDWESMGRQASSQDQWDLSNPKSGPP